MYTSAHVQQLEAQIEMNIFKMLEGVCAQSFIKTILHLMIAGFVIFAEAIWSKSALTHTEAIYFIRGKKLCMCLQCSSNRATIWKILALLILVIMSQLFYFLNMCTLAEKSPLVPWLCLDEGGGGRGSSQMGSACRLGSRENKCNLGRKSSACTMMPFTRRGAGEGMKNKLPIRLQRIALNPVNACVI